jgi:hypothetical protein
MGCSQRPATKRGVRPRRSFSTVSRRRTDAAGKEVHKHAFVIEDLAFAIINIVFDAMLRSEFAT